MNRRDALSALSLAAVSLGKTFAQEPPPGWSPPKRLTPESTAARQKARTRPLLCAYSGNLSKIPYPELSGIVGQMGYDGVDLTVMKGGHVDPSLYMVDLDRAFQVFEDAGIEVPMVTTSFTSPSDTYAYAVMYVSAQLGARFCRLGTWSAQNLPTPQNAQMRAMMIRNELTQFATTGSHCNIVPLLANHAGSLPGRSISEVDAMLTGVPATAFGYCFDPAQAVIEANSATGWEDALQAAIPRLAAVALGDVVLEKTENEAGARFCPLGEGVIDWKKLFAALAAARFHGPVSLHMDYTPRNSATAMTKDLAFARARVDEAWPL